MKSSKPYSHKQNAGIVQTQGFKKFAKNTSNGKLTGSSTRQKVARKALAKGLKALKPSKHS